MAGWIPPVRSMRLNSLSSYSRSIREMLCFGWRGPDLHILYHFTFFAVTVRSAG